MSSEAHNNNQRSRGVGPSAQTAQQPPVGQNEVVKNVEFGKQTQGVASSQERVPAPVSGSERRKNTRRVPRADRAFGDGVDSENHGRFLPRNWLFQIIGMVSATAFCFIASEGLPGLASILLLTAALFCTFFLSMGGRLLERQEPIQRIVSSTVLIALPLFLFGMGMSLWQSSGGLSWTLLVSSVLMTSGLASGHLRKRPGLGFVALFAPWSAVVIVNGSLIGLAVMAIAGVLAFFVARGQSISQQREDDARQTDERVQTRARDILADYEETGQGWFWETDRRSLLAYVSTPVAHVLDYEPEELLGQPLSTLFAMQESSDESERTLTFHLSARSAFTELSMRAATDEEERWWSVSGRPIYDDYNNFVGFRGSGTDLTERKRSQEHASRLALYDSLTGLANRHQMSQSLEKILESQQMANRCCTVMLLDLDRFKQVNDTMGHPAGDALLKQVSQRLESSVGRTGQVGRLGGDEFKVIIPNRVSREILGELAGQIIHALSQPYSIDGQRVVIGASLGIALSPDDGSTSEELIRNSDLALYAAKDGGRGRYHFYAEDLHADAEARAKMEEDLRDAIQQGDLQLFYQPVVSTATEKISGFEALLRWEHPSKGWISPEKFVTIAEESGLIVQLGEWAMRQACHDLSKWPGDVQMAVNVSPLQFANAQLPAMVTSAIANAGIDPGRLELEITESVFLADDEGTDAMFAALKGIGVRLALDDFGTGYSSLGYLKKAPFDKIKIDQSFVRGATEKGSRNGAIIASITSLAQSLGMDTTAEGVETLDELDLVRLHGCSHIQGYIYEKPMNAQLALARLNNGLAAAAVGPRSARATRQKMLRRVVLDHAGQRYSGTIRNISNSGALIEGLWNVPVDTTFKIEMSSDQTVNCVTRWSKEDRLGVEFETALDEKVISGVRASPAAPARVETLRKAS